VSPSRAPSGSTSPHSMAAQDATHPLWPSSWKEASGEATIKRRADPKPVKLFCGWFCPFAQRGWIACEAKRLDYQYVEVNPYEVDSSQPGGYTKRALPLSEKRERYPEFIAVSPRGLVPAMDKDGVAVWDSMPLVEFIDESFSGPRLFPSDAHQRARVRIYIAHCGDYIQKPYYTMLMAQDPSQRERAREQMLEGCRSLARAMSTDGDFFLGEQFSAFEIAIAPFWQRYLWVGSVYRGFSFPRDADFARLERWWSAVEKHPAVAATLVCRERLVSSYSDYAENRGTSEYAKAIQASLGASAASAVARAPCVVSSRATSSLIALAVGVALGLSIAKGRK